MEQSEHPAPGEMEETRRKVLGLLDEGVVVVEDHGGTRFVVAIPVESSEGDPGDPGDAGDAGRGAAR